MPETSRGTRRAHNSLRHSAAAFGIFGDLFGIAEPPEGEYRALDILQIRDIALCGCRFDRASRFGRKLTLIVFIKLAVRYCASQLGCRGIRAVRGITVIPRALSPDRDKTELRRKLLPCLEVSFVLGL